MADFSTMQRAIHEVEQTWDPLERFHRRSPLHSGTQSHRDGEESDAPGALLFLGQSRRT